MKIIPILEGHVSLLKVINDNATPRKDQFSIGWQELFERVITLCGANTDEIEKRKIIHKERMLPLGVYDDSNRTVIDYLEICWNNQRKYLDPAESYPSYIRKNAKRVMNEIAEALEDVFYFQCPLLME